MRALVIGYGNALRGDDGLGPYVAERIAARALPGVGVLAVHQLTPEMAAELAEVRLAVFVDARADAAGEPVEAARVAPGSDGPGLTHTCDLRALLALAQAVYGRAPEAWSVTVAGESFAPGEGLTAPARRHARAAAGRVEEILRTAPCP